MEHGSARIGEIFNFGMLHLEWPTALFILVVFLITMFLLNLLLFKPILKTLEQRQSDVDKNIAEKNSLSSQIAESESNYQSNLQKVRDKIQETRQESLNEALETAKQIIDQSQTSLTTKLEAADNELVKEKENAIKDAVSLSKDLSNLIRSKVLA